MERLTQWLDEERTRAIPRTYKNGKYEKITTLLARYEDTGLYPGDIWELKVRDTEKAPVCGNGFFGVFHCGTCNNFLSKGTLFCPHCGQRLKWEE